MADHPGTLLQDSLQCRFHIAGTRNNGVCPGDIKGAVIVRSADDIFNPGLFTTGFQAVCVRQTVDIFSPEVRQYGLQMGIGQIVAGTVEFEVFEQEQHLFEM